jgi:hypothetical protein
MKSYPFAHWLKKKHCFVSLSVTIKHNQSCTWCTTSNNILAYCYYPFFFHSQGVTSYFVVILNNLCNNHTIINAQGSLTGDKVIKPWTWLLFSCSVEVENVRSSTSICHCWTGSFSLCYVILLEIICRGTRWCSWLRHCNTSWKYAGSIPNGVVRIIPRHNPSGHTMALGSTQPLTEMSTGNIYLGGRGSCWQCNHLHALLSWNLGASNFWNPQGLSRPVQGLLYLC